VISRKADFFTQRRQTKNAILSQTLNDTSKLRFCEIGERIMAANLQDQLIDKVRALPPEKQQEALRLLDILATDASAERRAVDRRAVWEVVDEINAGLPADTWENVPTDGSINLDHYLYGAPKKQ
jgi:hypothetical protein